MSIPAASDSDVSDYEDVIDRLSRSDVDNLRDSCTEKCFAVTTYLLASRVPDDKRRLILNTLRDLLSAFNTMSTNYLRVRAMVNSTAIVKEVINTAIKREVTSAVQAALTSTRSSYASVASKPAPQQHSTKVKVTNGPTVTVPNTVSVVVGPKKESIAKFASADDTRKAMVMAVKPVDIGLRVNKIVPTRNNAIRIIADSVDLPKLKESPSLTAAGLEIKVRERLIPRLVIRDVPSDLSNEDLAAQIVSLNLEANGSESVKIVYRYPSRRPNGLASTVIETDSETRKAFLVNKKGRINLEWRSYRIEDYLRVLQCFKCQDFEHLAKNCSSGATCGNCAEAHDTSSCPSASTLKCVNCAKNKLTDITHKAFDAAKCPIIMKRLIEKAQNIAY